MDKLQTAMHHERHRLIRLKEYELRDSIIKGFEPSKGTINDLITREDRKNALNLYEQFLQGIFWDIYDNQNILDNHTQAFKNSLVAVTYKELYDWHMRIDKDKEFNL